MNDSPDKTDKKAISPLFRSVNPAGIGASPGTAIYIGDREPADTTFSLIQYNQNAVAIITPESVEEVILMQDPNKINWINVNGLGHEASFKRIRDFFRLDPLTMEDILNTEHRPKVEEFGHYILVIAKTLRKKEFGSIEYEQIAFILTDRTVITFSETTGDCFEPVRERLKLGSGRLRRLGTDYLLYALLDVIVDNYFAILEHLGTRLESFEDASMSSREAKHFMAGLQGIKAELNRMRRILWPVRDVVNGLMHTESALVSEGLDRYLRDLYENAIQALEVLENYRETAAGIQEIFFSSVSNRMNEVMKVLTIISTIFIPLTFIAGVYGMNFAHMPELDSSWGYPAVIGLMIAIAGGLLLFFKKKKWL
jgi:magnesium transporter